MKKKLVVPAGAVRPRAPRPLTADEAAALGPELEKRQANLLALATPVPTRRPKDKKAKENTSAFCGPRVWSTVTDWKDDIGTKSKSRLSAKAARSASKR